MNFVVDELAQAVLVDVNAAGLTVVDLTMNDRGISSSLDFEAGDSVVVNVVCFEVTQSVVESEDAHVAPMMDVVPSHYGVRVVFNPDTRKRVT